MARELTLAYPGDLDTLTGGYIYDKRILSELQSLGWKTHTLSLNAGFPAVDDTEKTHAANTLARVNSDQILVIDGLALGALGEHAHSIGAQRSFIALVHHPLALESGIHPHTAQALRDSERTALSYAQHVIVTSELTRQTLIEQYDVAPLCITVVEPGVDRPSPSTFVTEASASQRALQLLSVGALVPRKGFDILVKALAPLRELDWQLTIVGDDQRAPDHADQIKDLIKQFSLEGRICLTGPLAAEELARRYQQADLFVLASRYEGYGMAYTEALAWGLPVVGTNAGAATQTLATEAARVVAVDDVDALCAELRLLISDQSSRAQMQQAACKHAQRLPTWQASGEKFASALLGQ